jgi:hypothetical protein
MCAVPEMDEREFLVAAGTRDDAADLSLSGGGVAAASCASSVLAVWGHLLPPSALLVKPAGSKECANKPLVSNPPRETLAINSVNLISQLALQFPILRDFPLRLGKDDFWGSRSCACLMKDLDGGVVAGIHQLAGKLRAVGHEGRDCRGNKNACVLEPRHNPQPLLGQKAASLNFSLFIQ